MGESTYIHLPALSTERAQQQWHPGSNEHTQCPDFGFYYHSSIKGTKVFWRNVWFRAGVAKISDELERLIVPESNNC